MALPGLRSFFANRNQTHTCAPPRALEERFAGRSPSVIETYCAFEAAARANGPMTVVPEKTRIVFQVRMSFAAVTLRSRWVDGHVVLPRRLESPSFLRIETFSPRNHLHEFRLAGAQEVDEEVARWLRRRIVSAGRIIFAEPTGNGRPLLWA